MTGLIQRAQEVSQPLPARPEQGDGVLHVSDGLFQSVLAVGRRRRA